MSPSPDLLRERAAKLGEQIGAREAAHAAELREARERAEAWRRVAAAALDAFHEAAAGAGAPHLAVQAGEVHLDDKHARAFEFELRRGRQRAIVTVKSRGEVTLVGPFRDGKAEGPCKTFPWHQEAEIGSALGDFLAAFLEEATAP